MILTDKKLAIGNNLVSKIYRGNEVIFAGISVEIFPAPASSVTKGSISLGFYSRNIWDMQLYQGKIYIGIGNSSTIGPSVNAGPIPVYYFDPIAEEYGENEFIVDEEQIDIFKIIQGDLYIPGHDATESWDYGNFYNSSGDGNWTKTRNIPNGVHVYDMEYHDGKLFAALGTAHNHPPLLVSDDMGATWSSAYTSMQKRFYTCFMFKGEVYAVSMLSYLTSPFPDPVLRAYCLLRFNGTNFEEITYAHGVNMKPTMPTELHKVLKPTTFNDKLLYIIASEYNDHQSKPLALFVADEINVLNQVSRVRFNVTTKTVTAHTVDSIALWAANVDYAYVYASNFPHIMGGTANIDSYITVYDKDGNLMQQVASGSLGSVSSAGKYFFSNDGVIQLIFEKGAFGDLEEARALIGSITVTYVDIPEIPRDIIVRGNKVYVLTSIRHGEFNYTIIVYESTDAVTWTETVSFASDAYAQSFEEYEGNFYFGLGCTTTEIPASVGNIVKVAY